MPVSEHWIVYDKQGFGAHIVVVRERDADAFRRDGHAVEGPFVLQQPRGAVDREAGNVMPIPGRWIERVQEVVTEAHDENLGGKHRSGSCEACADAYLVAQRAVPKDEPNA